MPDAFNHFKAQSTFVAQFPLHNVLKNRVFLSGNKLLQTEKVIVLFSLHKNSNSEHEMQKT